MDRENWVRGWRTDVRPSILLCWKISDMENHADCSDGGLAFDPHVPPPTDKAFLNFPKLGAAAQTSNIHAVHTSENNNKTALFFSPHPFFEMQKKTEIRNRKVGALEHWNPWRSCSLSTCCCSFHAETWHFAAEVVGHENTRLLSTGTSWMFRENTFQKNI